VKLYVPYSRLGVATEVFLTSPLYTPLPVVLVDCTADDWAYQKYIEEVWAQGEDFINMEHDIVPWPGAVHELIKCAHPWCFFGYDYSTPDLASSGAAYFGLVRFRQSIIRQLADVWVDRRKQHWPIPWRGMDTHFFHYATRRDLWPHQHSPAVLNANPNILTCPGREYLNVPERRVYV
jgi:hypothetical protein